MRYIAAFATLVAGAAFVSAAPTCASRQYLDAATGLCKQCPTSTMTCSSATVAITCARGRYLTSTKQCVTGNACPSGTFADSATTTCKKCYGANVGKCKDATPTGATACVSGSCLSSGKCLYIARMLPTTFCSNGIVTACPNGASRCDSTGAVMSCKTGFNLAASGECVQCTGGATWNSATKTCDLACRTTATTHYEPDREESVIDSTAQYLDSATQTCKDCLDPFAKSCGNDGRATACLTEFYRGLTDEGTCIRCNTKPGYYLDDDSGKCELYCPSAQWNWQSTMQTGVAQYAVNGVCVDCADPLAYTCKNGVTGSCVPWAHLENGVCISWWVLLTHQQASRRAESCRCLSPCRAALSPTNNGTLPRRRACRCATSSEGAQ
ncbi:hypothetical protein DMC30DRAFT_252146 [Rhodotorula diobovata]|uniref:Uncharacterized protein n=1 Tax=Rhodotorula diobovata TaxID=5288 RepID=A0A5C5FXM9_9BASI|nr:hypothetical protein DMC30DRAFT_252146 [Rhodotorula diobovata]